MYWVCEAHSPAVGICEWLSISCPQYAPLCEGLHLQPLLGMADKSRNNKLTSTLNIVFYFCGEPKLKYSYRLRLSFLNQIIQYNLSNDISKKILLGMDFTIDFNVNSYSECRQKNQEVYNSWIANECNCFNNESLMLQNCDVFICVIFIPLGICLLIFYKRK